MRRYDVVTLFPEMFSALTGSGISRRAQERSLYRLQCWNPRDFAHDVHRTIDDRPYGGGPGMVMQSPPLEAAIAAAGEAQRDALGQAGRVIYLSPQGRPLDHARVMDLVQAPALTLLCGRYEGVDQRVIDRCVDEEISLGDFVLSGGELARVHIARLIAGGHELILADEPIANLDPRFQMEILGTLRRHTKEDRGAAVVLHDLNIAARHCDRLVLLNEGRAVATGTPQDVLTSDNIETVFGVSSRYLKDAGIDQALGSRTPIAGK